MYKNNLNFERFDRHFQEFLRKGLVEQRNDSNGKTVYVTSDLTGAALLDALKKARDTPKNLLWHKLLKPFPILEFNFEITRRCQSHCIYCHIWQSQSTQDTELSPDEIRSYLKPKELFAHVQSVGITGGEPTLRSDIVDVCQALKEVCPNASLGFPTNCLSKNVVEIAERIRNEVDPTFHVGLSLDGFKEINDFQRGTKGHYELVWETALQLREAKIPFEFGSTLTKFNINSACQFRNYLLEQGFAHSYDIVTESSHYYNNEGSAKNFALTKDDIGTLKKLRGKGMESNYRYFLPKYIENPRQLFKCFSGFASFFLNCQGDVYPCIHLAKKFGNVREQSFSSLWLGDAARQIRKSIHRKDCHCSTDCEMVHYKLLCYPGLIKQVEMLSEHLSPRAGRRKKQQVII